MTHSIRVSLMLRGYPSREVTETCTTSEPVMVGDHLPALIEGYGCLRVTQRRHGDGCVELVAEAWAVEAAP